MFGSVVLLSVCKQTLHSIIYNQIVMKFYKGVRDGKVNVIKFVVVIWDFLNETMSKKNDKSNNIS